jgi:4-amino-4-deoxy-L-arabinose transferase-like glycosyltransferase
MKALLDLLRRNKLFFLLVTLAALALRLVFVFRFPHVEGDAFIYGDIAKNWLTHGIYGLSAPSVQPTLIRLPGYPAFLALMFSIFGLEHYHAVMMVQAFIDTNTCLVIAALALELMNTRAAKAAYLLAALCPFTANYAATPMSETLAIFTTAHALYYGIRALKAVERGASATLLWITCGLWSSAAIYMRPDACLLIVPFSAALFYLVIRKPALRARIVVAESLLLLSACAPLIPWTLRNWRTFHVFQPLSPRYATDPREFVPMGFNHWVKTWIVDFVSVDEVYWHASAEPIDLASLPQRAFDSRAQYEQTESVLNAYNQQLEISPDLDDRFESLACARRESHPFRYYIWLPALRIADMWLRPRTEMMNIELRWWEFSEHTEESIFALAWAALNFLFLAVATIGWLRWRLGLCGLVLVGYLLLRSAFLGTLENPEPRYILECFPVILAFAGGAFARPAPSSQNATN